MQWTDLVVGRPITGADLAARPTRLVDVGALRAGPAHWLWGGRGRGWGLRFGLGGRGLVEFGL